MRNLLAPAQSEQWRKLMQRAPLLAFDFDGTLAPLVSDRDAARLPSSTKRLLKKVAALYPCAVVSGRGYRDVAKRVRGIDWIEIVGNHGAEWREPLPEAARAVAAVKALRHGLHPLITATRGLDLEDKRFSLSLHYRHVFEPAQVRRALLAALRKFPACRIVEGKCVLNVVPEGLPHKGDAVRRLMRSHALSRALYVGDDVTDEDVFREKRRGLVGIRVGRSRKSHASFYLSTQPDIDRFLLGAIALTK